MPRNLLLAALLLAATPAWAQVHPAAPLSPSGEQARAFSLKNMSHQAVVSARATMTDGHSRMLTYSPIEPGEAREVVVPRKSCLARVTVHLNNGRSLQADHLDDCRSDLLVVHDQGIDIEGAAVRRLRHGLAPLPRSADTKPQR